MIKIILLILVVTSSAANAANLTYFCSKDANGKEQLYLKKDEATHRIIEVYGIDDQDREDKCFQIAQEMSMRWARMIDFQYNFICDPINFLGFTIRIATQGHWTTFNSDGFEEDHANRICHSYSQQFNLNLAPLLMNAKPANQSFKK